MKFAEKDPRCFLILSNKFNMCHQQIFFALCPVLARVYLSGQMSTSHTVLWLWRRLCHLRPIQSSIILDNAQWKATTMLKAVFVQSQAQKAIGQDHNSVFSHLMKLTEKTKLDSSCIQSKRVRDSEYTSYDKENSSVTLGKFSQ